MECYIERINADTWRPGMPKTGYLVRYNPTDLGWRSCHTCATMDEAREFVKKLKDEAKK